MSIRDPSIETAGRSLTRLAVGVCLVVHGVTGSGAELVLQKPVVQRVVANNLFSNNGRWYLLNDNDCNYAYLESPQIELAEGRLVLRAHLSSRFGGQAPWGCFGGGFASNVVVSGVPQGSGGRLALRDIQLRIEDEATAAVFNLVQANAAAQLPRVLEIDVRDLMTRQLSGTTPYSLTLEALQIQAVNTSASGITIVFDFRLVGT